jgi:hypothetical protein
MTIDAAIASAETAVVEALLVELCASLVAKGALLREDLAGALLRTEASAEAFDEVAAEDGDIMRHHASAAAVTTEKWSEWFGLEPSLYALRRLNTEAQDNGLHRRALLSAGEVADWSKDDD